MSPHRSIALAAVIAVGLSLTGCSDKSEEKKTEAAPSSVPASQAPLNPAGTECAGLAVGNAWVKANEPGKTMTGAFATVKNAGSTEVHITGGSTERAKTVELHTTGADGTMTAKADGFVLKPGGTLALAPGKDHLMLIDLNGDLLPGETLPVILHCADGSKIPMPAQVRAYKGAQENYTPAGSATTGAAGTTAPGATVPGASPTTPGAPGAPAVTHDPLPPTDAVTTAPGGGALPGPKPSK